MPPRAEGTGPASRGRRRRPRLAILTSGGDAPGMNAVLAGALQAAEAAPATLLGIPAAFEGLAEGRSKALPPAGMALRSGHSGTFLGTSRNVDLRQDRELDRCLTAVGSLRLEGLI